MVRALDDGVTTGDAEQRIKVPPHSIEAEQSLLGGLMLDHQSWDKIADVVTEQDFYRKDHRLIFAARRELWWTRSTESDVAFYRVKQQRAAAGLATIAEPPATDEWSYRTTTPRLDDLTNYDWEILPVDAAGNEGTALVIQQEQVVRTPDAPDFTVSFDGGTTRVTFTAVP